MLIFFLRICSGLWTNIWVHYLGLVTVVAVPGRRFFSRDPVALPTAPVVLQAPKCACNWRTATRSLRTVTARALLPSGGGLQMRPTRKVQKWRLPSPAGKMVERKVDWLGLGSPPYEGVRKCRVRPTGAPLLLHRWGGIFFMPAGGFLAPRRTSLHTGLEPPSTAHRPRL